MGIPPAVTPPVRCRENGLRPAGFRPSLSVDAGMQSKNAGRFRPKNWIRRHNPIRRSPEPFITVRGEQNPIGGVARDGKNGKSASCAPAEQTAEFVCHRTLQGHLFHILQPFHTDAAGPARENTAKECTESGSMPTPQGTKKYGPAKESVSCTIISSLRILIFGVLPLSVPPPCRHRPSPRASPNLPTHRIHCISSRH